MKYSDRPITDPAHDLLGRNSFAKTLAKAIDEMPVAADGFVMGLTGKWGSGKSSVIELLCRELAFIDLRRMLEARIQSKLDTVPAAFDVETASTAYQRVKHLITTLLNDGKDPSMWAKDSMRVAFGRILTTQHEVEAALIFWDLLSAVEKQGRTIILRFSPWSIPKSTELSAALLEELASPLAARLGRDVSEAFAELLSHISLIGGLASSFMSAAGAAPFATMFQAGADFSGKIADSLSTRETLDTLRSRLREALASISPQKIFVIIDDLDRLKPKEALRMVSLVKTLGDMPNTVYLLSYDRTRLSTLLDSQGVGGDDYLSKIVQYSVDLPPIQSSSLVRLLMADLVEIFGTLDQRETDAIYELWQYGLNQYVSTPREVRRLANALAVPAAALKDFTYLPDLVALETLRVFDAPMYEFVRDHIDELTR